MIRRERVDETVVPARWRHTRDLASYQRCHGAATFLGSYQLWDEAASGRCFHGGQLTIALPPSADGEVVTLQIEYVVADPRGGVHFARALALGPPTHDQLSCNKLGACRPS